MSLAIIPSGSGGGTFTAGAGNYTTGGATYGNAGHPAEGRLTLSSATPVMVSDVSNSTAIYYTMYTGNHIALYDGTDWVTFEFTELTNTTTDATKNPAAVAADSNYDLFVWSDSGTLRLGRGPAWTSATARGTGAGTTELERVDGTWVNKIAITNGPAAQRGRYVGTIRSDGSSTIDWELGGTAANGDPGFLYVWNMYNRVPVSLGVFDNTNSWTYNVSTWRASNNSTSMRISFVRGMNEDACNFRFNQGMSQAVANNCGVGIGIDSTSAFSGSAAAGGAASAAVTFCAIYSGIPGVGMHYAQALEFGQAATTCTFYGDAGVVYWQSGFFGEVMA